MARRNPIDRIPGLTRITGPALEAVRHPRDAVAVALHQARTTTALGRTVAGQVVEQVAHAAQSAHLRETAEAVRQRVLARAHVDGRHGTDAPSVESVPAQPAGARGRSAGAGTTKRAAPGAAKTGAKATGAKSATARSTGPTRSATGAPKPAPPKKPAPRPTASTRKQTPAGEATRSTGPADTPSAQLPPQRRAPEPEASPADPDAPSQDG